MIAVSIKKNKKLISNICDGLSTFSVFVYLQKTAGATENRSTLSMVEPFKMKKSELIDVSLRFVCIVCQKVFNESYSWIRGEKNIKTINLLIVLFYFTFSSKFTLFPLKHLSSSALVQLHHVCLPTRTTTSLT